MGQLRYLSALKYSEMMIGNSSSGIIEMPFFKKPTINIGDRQKGRIFSDSIIQCELNRKFITEAIAKAQREDFKKKCKNPPSLYGNGKAANKTKKMAT